MRLALLPLFHVPLFILVSTPPNDPFLTFTNSIIDLVEPAAIKKAVLDT